MRKRSASLAAAAAGWLLLAAPAPLQAQAEQQDVISGRCEYSDAVARYRFETALILCDTVVISRDGPDTVLDFKQRDWGSRARVTGRMSGDTLSITEVALRDGQSAAATGTCKFFRHLDGRLSVIGCLAKRSSRSIAVNFVPSRV